MNQPKTQSHTYWADEFSVADSDIEQLYNHFLEVERPQKVDQIAQVIISHRVAEERSRIKKLLTGRTAYQPKDSHKIGEELVFPALRYAFGEVTSTREGYDPRYGHYTVIDVEIEEGEFTGADREVQVCYFNGVRYAVGDYVCSGNELLRCENGVWVRSGSCYE